TTMSEIAKDCNMSVGNLYRHFDNKSSIMVACLKQQLQDKLDAGITAAAHHTGLKALRAFFQSRLKLGHLQFAETRHLLDLFIAIESSHRDLLLLYEDRVIVAITEILDKGVQTGVFSCRDTQQTAYDIHQATLRYNHPLTLQNNTLDQLTTDLDRLLDLLYSGLQSR
ncbi:MAG: TetR/AcrR family transcriptional regulator, partial [Mariprofundales bacterium]|nr:TetR/AcrR family transcriptional regulator [Mariprofundales bacterium]